MFVAVCGSSCAAVVCFLAPVIVTCCRCGLLSFAGFVYGCLLLCIVGRRCMLLSVGVCRGLLFVIVRCCLLWFVVVCCCDLLTVWCCMLSWVGC